MAELEGICKKIDFFLHENSAKKSNSAKNYQMVQKKLSNGAKNYFALFKKTN